MFLNRYFSRLIILPLAAFILSGSILKSNADEQFLEDIIVTDPLAPIVLSALQNSHFNQLCGQLLRAAYAYTDIEVEVLFLPAARGTLLSTSGSIDGDAGRTTRFKDEYPHMLKVEPSYISISWHLFVMDPLLAEQRDVELTKIRLGVLRGVLFTDKLTEGLQPLEANSIDQLFHLLLADRVDAVIFSGFSGDRAITSTFKGKQILKRATPVHVEPIFLFLHPKHSLIVPKVSSALRLLTQSGQSKRIIDRFNRCNQPSDPVPCNFDEIR